MGFMDKVGASLKNADSKLGQGIDESKIKTKIGEKNAAIDKLYRELGEAFYKKADGWAARCDELAAEIGGCNAEIAELEKRLEDVKKKGEDERKANSAAAEL